MPMAITETVIRREKISWRKKCIVLLYWGVFSLILLTLALNQALRYRDAAVASVFLGFGLLKGLQIGREKEPFARDNPRETI